MTEGLSQNIMFQFVVIPFKEECLSADLVCIEAFLHIKNYSKFPYAHMQKFPRLGSVEEYFCS